MKFIYEKERIVVFSEDGTVIAEVDFPLTAEDTVDVNHTFVDDSLRGQGVAGKLMEELVKELRNNKLKAVLTCSYAVSWFNKHQEYNDVLKK